MPTFLCTACGTSYPEAAEPPGRCPICADERQYVPVERQRWTTPAALALGHTNAWRQREPDLFEIQTQPAFGIGQRAFLIRTPTGNLLWDCVALCDAATRALVEALGGITGIAISHPHYYTTMQDWAAALDAPVYLHARDRAWVMRPDDRLAFWEEDVRPLGPGLMLHRLGGHFPGSTVLHWAAGAAGAGALMVGDTLQVGADRKSVSFQWSYPNALPLSGASVARIAARLDGLRFARIYGAFGLHIREGADAVVRASAARYRALLDAEQP
ncbi:MBL fold metallo-hydrolase [Methylobacterium sp. NEAU 140]|uniref:MBL fold metallo-hydrolase n=1 Tax=Methylobacterium sp. NEAU 140 TaxID=3064945 RepID=UPI0027352155|nr:MBL fold metallo-hydrolase [Methylobacterium sp. NEAU 140]MDP4022695.1 MBL fold metallo-hydrolase [Methylobacterium sp. NEAU 140]